MIGMFVFSNFIITAEQKQQVRTADQLCNFDFSLFGISVSDVVKTASPEIAQQCEEAAQIKQILSYEIYAYAIGFILVVLGLALGNGGGNVREIIREVPKIEHKGDDEEEETKPIKKTKVKYCPKCGNRVKRGEKFCGSCGKKVK